MVNGERESACQEILDRVVAALRERLSDLHKLTSPDALALRVSAPVKRCFLPSGCPWFVLQVGVMVYPEDLAGPPFPLLDGSPPSGVPAASARKPNEK